MMPPRNPLNGVTGQVTRVPVQCLELDTVEAQTEAALVYPWEAALIHPIPSSWWIPVQAWWIRFMGWHVGLGGGKLRGCAGEDMCGWAFGGMWGMQTMVGSVGSYTGGQWCCARGWGGQQSIGEGWELCGGGQGLPGGVILTLLMHPE